MALAQYIERQETVEIPGNDPLVVRGFSLPDILLVVHRHKGMVEELFGRVANGDLRSDTVEQTIMAVIGEFSPVVGQIIASAAGEPDQWETAMRLPLGVQVEALDKIIALTFESHGGVEKFLGIIAKAMGNVVPKQP